MKTERLQRNRELNLPVPTARANDPAQRPFFGLTTGTPRPLTALGSVQVRESTASSKYQALTFSTKLQKKRLTANVYYVLSKSESDDDNERDSGGPGAENTFNLDARVGAGAPGPHATSSTGSPSFTCPRASTSPAASGSSPAVPSTPASDPTPTATASPPPTGPSAPPACPSPATASATSR